MKEKIGFKDLTIGLKIVVVGGTMWFLWKVIVLIAFIIVKTSPK